MNEYTSEEIIAACKEALEAWSAWEADIIFTADWSSGRAHLTQAQHDALPAIQAKRIYAFELIQGEPIF